MVPRYIGYWKKLGANVNDTKLRQHLLELLQGGGAHLGWEEAVSDFPAKMRGVKPQGAQHTAWQLLEHLRIALWDILEFSRDPRHRSPDFPAGYWPATDAPPDAQAWEGSISAIRKHIREMCALIGDESRDLFARIDHPEAKEEHTLLREALLVADHNAYHVGQLVQLRRFLGTWPGA